MRSKSIVFYNKDHQEDTLYDFAKANNNILNWKAHILRSCSQDKAKQDLLRNLDASEAIIVMD